MPSKLLLEPKQTQKCPQCGYAAGLILHYRQPLLLDREALVPLDAKFDQDMACAIVLLRGM